MKFFRHPLKIGVHLSASFAKKYLPAVKSEYFILSFDANFSSFPLVESPPRDLQITAYKKLSNHAQCRSTVFNNSFRLKMIIISIKNISFHFNLNKKAQTITFGFKFTETLL